MMRIFANDRKKSNTVFEDWRIGYTSRFSYRTHQPSSLSSDGQAIAESFAALVKQGSSFTFGDGQPGSPQPGIVWEE